MSTEMAPISTNNSLVPSIVLTGWWMINTFFYHHRTAFENRSIRSYRAHRQGRNFLTSNLICSMNEKLIVFCCWISFYHLKLSFFSGFDDYDDDDDDLLQLGTNPSRSTMVRTNKRKRCESDGSSLSRSGDSEHEGICIIFCSILP